MVPSDVTLTPLWYTDYAMLCDFGSQPREKREKCNGDGVSIGITITSTAGFYSDVGRVVDLFVKLSNVHRG